MLGLINTLKSFKRQAPIQYIRDSLKLYMPYKTNDEVQFVGTGSTSFDGNDYISCGNDSSLQFGTGDFSLSMWVKRGTIAPTDDFQNLISYGDDDGIYWYFRFQSANKLFFRTKDSDGDLTSTTSASAITDTTNWHHVAVTFDRDSATGVKIYIDGVLDQTGDHTASSATLNHASDGLLIGTRNSGGSYTQHYDGSLKNCAIWNRVLTDTEIQNVMYKQYAEVRGRLASGLVSWWTLEKTLTSTTTKDVHGSNNGTLGDGITAGTAPTFNSGVYGDVVPVIPRSVDNAPTVQADAIGSGSAALDGSTDYISVADDSSLDITSDFSITCWVKFDSFDSAVDGIMHKGDPSSGDGYGLYVNNSDSKVKFFSNNYNSDYAETGALSVNTWYHIAGTYSDSGNLNSIYVDGVLIDTSAETTAMVADNEPLEIGRTFQDNGYNLNGNLCQVGIWRGALSQETIQSVMEKTFEELTATEKSSLGSEEINDGDFTTTGTQSTSTQGSVWETETGWTIASGKATLTNPASAGYDLVNSLSSSNDDTIVANKVYKCVFTIESITTGSVYLRLGGVTGIQYTSAGTYTEYIKSSDTNAFRLRSGSGFTGTIVVKDISCKAVTHDLVSYWALDEAVTDSADTQWAYNKVNGTETLGEEVIGDSTFDDASYWTVTAGASGSIDVNSTNAGKCTSLAGQDIYLYTNSNILTIGKLYKIQITCDSYTTGNARNIGTSYWGRAWDDALVEGVWTKYAIAKSQEFRIFFHNSGVWTATDISCKEVLNGENVGELL